MRPFAREYGLLIVAVLVGSLVLIGVLMAQRPDRPAAGPPDPAACAALAPLMEAMEDTDTRMYCDPKTGETMVADR